MAKGMHHVAYRCADADATIDFYTRLLGLPLGHALFNDRVPSTQKLNPHLHIFFELDDGSYLAFFELPLEPAASKDPNTPDWVQHLALEVADQATLLASKARLRDGGVEVIGPIDHGFCQSIYFFDPSGHRMELTTRTEPPGALEKFRAHAPEVLQQWRERKARGWETAA